MALHDEKGTAIFSDNGSWGHFVFVRYSGKDESKPYIVQAEITKCHLSESPKGWKAALRKLSDYQMNRRAYNPQMSYPLEAIPALIAALSKTYEELTLKSAPVEGQVYLKEFTETEAEQEAAAFARGSSEF